MVTITRSGDTLTQEIPADQVDDAKAKHDNLAATGKLTDDQIAALDPPPSADSIATGLLAYSSDQRWQKEVGGITVNGIYMPTDEQTQYTLTGAVTMVQVAPDTVIQWKIADGTFVTLPGPELVMLAQAVATHVQNCFGVEAGPTGPVRGPNAPPPPPPPTGPTITTITPIGLTITTTVTDAQISQAQDRHNTLAESATYTDAQIASLDPPPAADSVETGLLA
jgi:hypothetical protein